jgi:hypothetical protein
MKPEENTKRLIKSVAKSIERELGYTNGWLISDENYRKHCEKVAARIVKRIHKEVFDF